MSGDTSLNEFRLGRLRFIRLPPTSISFPLERSKTDSTAFELGVGITDDYGTDIDLFESINLRLEVVSGEDAVEGLGLKLAADERSKVSTLKPWIDFTFTPTRGPFHMLSLKLVALSSKGSLPEQIRFRLSVAPSTQSDSSLESAASRRIREIIGEPSQTVLETWNDSRYLLMGVESGEVELARRSTATNSPEKVQTTLRRIHYPQSPPLTIVERPGLNNSTGQRLWDCAIGISAFFSLHDNTFDPTTAIIDTSKSTEDDGASRSKKRRKTSKRTRVVELGAGCALASLVAGQVIRSIEGEVSVVATDIEATVETTLLENLNFNETVTKGDRRVLDWGALAEDQVKNVLGVESIAQQTDLSLIATDVLYNPESHQLLLDTLLSFLRPSSAIAPILSNTSSRALIAYKRRTEGDDGFFGLAREAGLKTEKVWEWSEVSVWCFT
ncbi:hypothetical protein JCM5350_003393 [Sporobolomyces pararoseus]